MAQAPTIIVPGLPGETNDTINTLMRQLETRAPGNLTRAAHYDQHTMARALSNARRAEFRKVQAVMGWTTKAVDALGNLIVFDGLAIPGAEVADFGLDAYLTNNRLIEESAQIQTDALIHGPAFLVTTRGDTTRGEPAALTTTATALAATGTWDARLRQITAFLSVTAVDADKRPTAFTLYVPHEAHACERIDGEWAATTVPTGLPFVPVEPLVYRPRIGRPFGSSRVSRAAISAQAGALRTVVRSELGAEAYIDPVRAFLGADNKQFLNEDGTPNAAAQGAASGRVIVVPPNWTGPAGDPIADDQSPIIPKLETIPGSDMRPHRDQLEMFAGLFSAETDLPLSEMGIRGGSVPVSAQALQASRNSLNLMAEAAIRTAAPAWVRSAQTAYMIGEGITDRAALPEPLRKLAATFREPSRPSRGEVGDFMLKVTTAGIVPAESRVALEALGFSQSDIERILADRRQSQGLASLADIAATITGRGAA